MNTPKHTPGPYALPLVECDMEAVGADIGADGEWTTIHTVDHDGPADIIAACHRENAPLFSAAPELLEALRNFVATIDVSGGVAESDCGLSAPVADPEWCDLGDAYHQARAAIAKAEGRE